MSFVCGLQQAAVCMYVNASQSCEAFEFTTCLYFVYTEDSNTVLQVVSLSVKSHPICQFGRRRRQLSAAAWICRSEI